MHIYLAVSGKREMQQPCPMQRQLLRACSQPEVAALQEVQCKKLTKGTNGG